jgi:hypothetical protein
MNDKQVYTVQDIMSILDISKNMAYKFIKDDPPFKVIRIGDLYRINKESFDSWLLSA